MKKLIALIATLIITFVMSVLVASPAQADNRLSISPTSRVAFFGTKATLFTGISTSIPEYANYNWSRMKYEIEAQYSSPFTATVDAYQGNTGVWQVTTFSSKRLVVTASASVTSSSQSLNSLRLNQTDGEAQVFRVRTWLDRNNNDEVDPFEPVSGFSSITTIDPSKAKSYLAFQVDPPRFADAKISASIGGSAISKYSIIDPTLVTMKVHTCGYDGCVRVSGGLTYNAMPQLIRYEFSTATNFRSEGVYVVELFYAQTATVNVLLDSETFEYKKKIPNEVSTKLSLPTGISALVAPSASVKQVKTQLTTVPLSLESFTYTATLKDPDKALVTDREVYVYLDMKDIKTPANFLVDGVQVTSSVRDEVLLKRVTDSNGELKLNITYPDPTILERVEIDIQINGIRPYEFSTPASEQALLWNIESSRTLALYLDKNQGTSISPVSVNAVILNASNEIVKEGAVVFTPDRHIILDSPAATIDSNGRATISIRISNLAPKSGEGFVTAAIVGPTGVVTNKLLVSWTNYGEIIKVSGPDQAKFLSTFVKVSVLKKTATVSVNGLALTDVVTICQNSKCVKSVRPANQTFTFKNFVHISGAKYLVRINGIQIFSRIVK